MACSFTFEETLGLIKEAIDANKGRIRKNNVLSYLMIQSGQGKGMSYKDANEITDFYFNVVKKKFQEATNADARLNNLQKKAAEEYFETNQINYNENDFNTLNHIWQKQDKALTPTEKSRYNEEAQNLLERKDERYNNRIVEAFIWTKPLTSIFFNAMSLRSNLSAIRERGLSEAFNYKNGKLNIDLNALKRAWDIDKQSRLAAKETLRGSVPVTNIINFETSDEAMSRVEEYAINPTSKTKGVYLNAVKSIAKYGARTMNAIDVFGAINNANKIYYSLYKNHIKEENPKLTEKEAEQMAYDHTYNLNKQAAYLNAIKMFKNLGEYPVDAQAQKDFLKSGRFKLAVEEMSRTNRDEHLMKLAYQYAKNDFWKKRMIIKSELGFGETGIGGIMAQVSNGISSAMSNILTKKTFSFKEGSNKSIVGDLLKQRMFGYVNGASAFMEDKLEHFILYDALKVYLLNRHKATAEGDMLDYIERRQRDMIVKGTLGIVKGAIAIGLKTLAENIICPDKGNADSFDIGDSYNNRSGFSLCGYQIPLAMSEQDKLTYDLYNMLTKGEGSGTDMLSFIIQEVLGNNRFASQSSLDFIQERVGNYNHFQEQGNEAAAEKEKEKAIKRLSDEVAAYTNAFLPIPSRVLQETKTLVQPLTGIGEEQQYKAQGILDQFRHSMVNAMGLSDLYQISGKGKPVFDYLDRKVYDRTGGGVTGNGIQYNKVDGLLATLNIRPPYTDRYTQVISNVEKTGEGKITTKRFLTDDEYYNLSKAKSELVKEYFDNNFDELSKGSEDKSRSTINKYFDAITRYGTKYFLDHEDTSIESIKDYIGSISFKEAKTNKTILKQ